MRFARLQRGSFVLGLVASLFACNSLLGTEPGDAKSALVEGRHTTNDAGPPIDNTPFCRAMPGAIFCRQFDDGTTADRGGILLAEQGSVTIDQVDERAPSPPGFLRLTSIALGGKAAFTVLDDGPDLVGGARAELKFKLEPSAADREFARFESGPCVYSIGSKVVQLLVYDRDGGVDAQETYPLSPELPLGRWATLAMVVKHESDLTSSFNLAVDGRPQLDAVGTCPRPPPDKIGTAIVVGTHSGEPMDLRIDDLVLGTP
jgi:hypothetical protein